jgi:hypothetical protein
MPLHRSLVSTTGNDRLPLVWHLVAVMGASASGMFDLDHKREVWGAKLPLTSWQSQSWP